MAGGWVVGTKRYVPALLVTATLAGSLKGLTFEQLDLAVVPDLGPIELLLLGTGDVMRAPTEAMAAAAAARGWRLAAMDSAAAARTFNVLLAEDRQVAALLLAEADPPAVG